MAVKRNLPRVFASTHQSIKPNLLVSGCSYTWNNSLNHIVTWPNYLKDIANYTQVFDCSQAAGGNAHVFNSIVYELSINSELTPDNTDIIIMWSGLERTDLLTSDHVVNQWYHMDHITFNQGQLASLNVWPDASWRRPKSDEINQFLKTYRVLISNRAQVLESCIRIVALDGYLKSLGFDPVFTTYRPMQIFLSLIEPDPIVNQVLALLAPLEDLDSFTTRVGTRMSKFDLHPTPDSHLAWTREILIPFLTGRFITVK